MRFSKRKLISAFTEFTTPSPSIGLNRSVTYQYNLGYILYFSFLKLKILLKVVQFPVEFNRTLDLFVFFWSNILFFSLNSTKKFHI